jgi:hypothetical protein
MRLRNFFLLATAGLATASRWNFETSREYLDAEGAISEWSTAHHEQIKAALATSDVGAMSKFLTAFNEELANFDKIVADITKDNIVSQMDKWVGSAGKLAKIADDAAPVIKTSGPIEIFSAMGLLGPGMTFFREVNSTLHHIIDSRQLILDAKLEDKVKQSLVQGKHAMLSMAVAIPGQIPESVYGMITSVTGIKLPPPPTVETATPLIDGVVDFIFKV